MSGVECANVGKWGAFDAADVAPPVLSAKKAVRVKLATMEDLQRALGRLIRQTMAGSIPTADLSRYANAIAVLGRLIEGGQVDALAARLDAIEASK